MNLRAFKIFFCVFISVFIFSSCAPDRSVAPVALNEPEGVSNDTFIVRRDNFYVQTKYPGYVKCYSEGLFFTKGGLPVLSIDAPIGAKVKKGDALITLNTESIEKQIKELEESIAETKNRNAYANKIKETDVMIAALELADARRRGNADEIKRREYVFDRLSLDLAQSVESQDFELTRHHGRLSELYSQLENTVIYAPYDGTVVAVSTRRQAWVQAYRPVVYVADETRLEVLYSGRDSLGSSRNARVTARILDMDYDVKYIELPTDEFLRYIIAGMTPPSRFEFLNPDDKLSPGQFVEISVIMREEPDVLIIPVNAVYRGETEEESFGVYVYVMENGLKIPRMVELGGSNESYHIVKSGLSEGEEVFVKQ